MKICRLRKNCPTTRRKVLFFGVKWRIHELLCVSTVWRGRTGLRLRNRQPRGSRTGKQGCTVVYIDHHVFFYRSTSSILAFFRTFHRAVPFTVTVNARLGFAEDPPSLAGANCKEDGLLDLGMWALSRIENASRHSIDCILVLSANGRFTSII